MEYHNLLISILVGFLGLVAGSFAGASVWRLRARQLREDDAAGEKISSKDKKQVSNLKKTTLLEDRSVCLHCGHQLQWFDLIPLFSWVSLGGKCRYCHTRIGVLEPLLELGMAAFFVTSYLFLPLTNVYDILHLILWLVCGVGLAMLMIYDARWFLLPNRVVFPLIGVGILNALVVLVRGGFSVETIMTILDACLILSGLYYLLYVGSRHQWVGFGDVKLGLVLALMLADWRLALLSLFLANAIGTIIVLPLLVVGKLDRKTRIPFGPLLIAGWAVTGLFGEQIIRSYLSLALGVS